MNTKAIIAALAAIGLAGAAGYGVYQLGVQQGAKSAAPNPPAANDKIDPATGRKVLYWHDPMTPGPRFDKPGKSPFMDMELVPVYADEAGAEGGAERGASISPQVQQNLGIRTAEVKKGTLASAFDAVGSVAFNERDVVVVQARANGFVERLHARAPLDRVRKGQALAEIYVPDWVAAQEEFLSVKRMGNASGTEGLLDAARQRMRLAGMNDEQVRMVETSGKVYARMTVVAPVGGTIAELGAREGMAVMTGTTLFRINGLDTVWVNADVPETAAARLRPGTPVEARAQALPGFVFKGKVGAILPEVNAATRTLKARIELANPSGELVPGMFASLRFNPASSREVLLVPSEAVIQTGTRNVVMVAAGEGRFRAADVETGAEAGGLTEIRKGLEAGQKVVVSGQFLVDSEASLKAAATRMGDTEAKPEGKAGEAAAGKTEGKAGAMPQQAPSAGAAPSHDHPEHQDHAQGAAK